MVANIIKAGISTISTLSHYSLQYLISVLNGMFNMRSVRSIGKKGP